MILIRISIAQGGVVIKVSELTNKSLVILNSNLNKKDDIINLLVKKLFRCGKISSEKQFLKALYSKEDAFSTGIENGVAIAMAMSTCVSDVTFAVISTKEIVSDWKSIGKHNEIKYIFLIAIPAENDDNDTNSFLNQPIKNERLQLISSLLQKLNKDSYKNQLFNSETVAEFMMYLDLGYENYEEEKSIVIVTSCGTSPERTKLAANAFIEAANELGVKVYVEEQNIGGITNRVSNRKIRNSDAIIFAINLAVRESKRFDNLAVPLVKVHIIDAIRDAKSIILDAIKQAENYTYDAEYEDPKYIEISNKIYSTFEKSILAGITSIIPIVMIGTFFSSISIILTLLFEYLGIRHADMSFINTFNVIGTTIVDSLLTPILAAYMAYSIGGKEANATGFISGLVANVINGGILAGIIGGLLSGIIVKYIKRFISNDGYFAWFINYWIYPVFGATLTAIIMILFIGEPVRLINEHLTTFLGYIDGNGVNNIVIGVAIGIMVSFDLGGPINKIATAYCINAVARGDFMPYAVLASTKMVSGFSITFATLLRGQLFTNEERELGNSTWILALAGITEGSIPFMLSDPARIILSFCVGSAVTGGIVSYYNIGLDVTDVGVLSMFMISYENNILGVLIWLGAAIIGALCSATMLSLLKKEKFESEFNSN